METLCLGTGRGREGKGRAGKGEEERRGEGFVSIERLHNLGFGFRERISCGGA